MDIKLHHSIWNLWAITSSTNTIMCCVYFRMWMRGGRNRISRNLLIDWLFRSRIFSITLTSRNTKSVLSVILLEASLPGLVLNTFNSTKLNSTILCPYVLLILATSTILQPWYRLRFGFSIKWERTQVWFS